MRIIFLGNHTVGVRVLKVMLETEEVAGVVAHPLDPEDGVKYLSVYDYAHSRGLNVVRMNGRDAGLEDFVGGLRPDLLWITDYRYLIPRCLLQRAPIGAVNLHPSLLPKYRGRAPINWAILNGEKQLGLTAHFLDEGMDSGDIIEQFRLGLPEHEDVGDALEKLYPLYERMTHRVLEYFRLGCVPRRPQNHAQATVFPRRRPEDGLIDWHQAARRIRDLIRAVARPYPGAFTFQGGRKIVIYSATLDPKETLQGLPGQVLALDEEGFKVGTGTDSMTIKEAEWAHSDEPVRLRVGDVLGSM